MNPIHIVGSGLVGPLAAIFLARKGFGVCLHERREDMRRVDMAAGRSINLAVTSRGLKALAEVGVQERVLEIAIPMKGRNLHNLDGTQTFVPYGQKDSEVIYSVSRGSLNKLLLEIADGFANVEIFFRRRCTHYDADDSTLGFLDETTHQEVNVHADVIIATDGAWSVIRKSIQERTPDFACSESILDYGYKELMIPPAADGSHRMKKNALHIWPRKKHMLIALPNLDGSFTCTLFLAFKGEESFATLQTPAEVTSFFQRHFPDALDLMPTLSDDFVGNPTGSMVTIKCQPWHLGGQAMLLGDAAHAIVPFFGQGMNCGFEDCSALGSLLKDRSPDWASLFAALEAERKPNADAIADMAVENFVEMRDTVANPHFLLKKQIGFELEKRYPERFVPHYAMVVFHPEIPYAEARRRSRIQDRILEELSVGVSSVDQIDWNKAHALLMDQPQP